MTSVMLAVLLTTSAVQTDAAFHFTAGLSAGTGAHTLATAYAPQHSLLLSLSAVVLTAGGKEMFDLAHGLAGGPGTADPRDFFYSVAGGLVGIGVSIVLQFIFAGPPRVGAVK